MSDSEKLKRIEQYLKDTRKELNKCLRGDYEYTNAMGNGINSSEADGMFEEVEQEIKAIIKSK